MDRTELGRQPWIYYGVMRIREAVNTHAGLVAPFVYLHRGLHLSGNCRCVSPAPPVLETGNPCQPQPSGVDSCFEVIVAIFILAIAHYLCAHGRRGGGTGGTILAAGYGTFAGVAGSRNNAAVSDRRTAIAPIWGKPTSMAHSRYCFCCSPDSREVCNHDDGAQHIRWTVIAAWHPCCAARVSCSANTGREGVNAGGAPSFGRQFFNTPFSKGSLLGALTTGQITFEQGRVLEPGFMEAG